MEQIIVNISPDGAVVVETKGFKGMTCKTQTEALKRALGEVTESKDTTEMYTTSAALTARNR